MRCFCRWHPKACRSHGAEPQSGSWIPRRLTHLLCHCHPAWHRPGSCRCLSVSLSVQSPWARVWQDSIHPATKNVQQSLAVFSSQHPKAQENLIHTKAASRNKHAVFETEFIKFCQHIHRHYRRFSRNPTPKILLLENPGICSAQCASGLKQLSLPGYQILWVWLGLDPPLMSLTQLQVKQK